MVGRKKEGNQGIFCYDEKGHWITGGAENARGSQLDRRKEGGEGRDKNVKVPLDEKVLGPVIL